MHKQSQSKSCKKRSFLSLRKNEVAKCPKKLRKKIFFLLLFRLTLHANRRKIDLFIRSSADRKKGNEAACKVRFAFFEWKD